MLVGEISMVLVDLGLPPNQGSPYDPGKARDVLEAADTILECLQEVHASGVGP
jgi:hypothetical protein